MAATVLVIDDDIQVRKSLVSLLEARGYLPLAVASQDEAFAVLTNEPIDILIYELGISSADGLNLLERIKQSLPNLPVIVMSALGKMDDVIQALRLGADDYLVQPLSTPEVLLHAVEKALNRSYLEAQNLAYRNHLESTNHELNQRLEELRNDQIAGREIQMRMLPKPLAQDGIQCSHRIIPALFLSGDFLDYFKINQHQIAFYLADVSGHGASSAFVTVLLKKLIEQLRRNYKKGQSEEILSPTQVLSFINADIEASQLDKYLTMFYGVLNTQTNQLEYSVGGHLPMPVIWSNGQANYLEGQGMPVGLFAEASYNTYHSQLPENFRLLLFSDGVLELIEEQSITAKEAKLLELVSSGQGDLSLLSNWLHIDEQTEIPDDITMVCISREA